jgi:serine/threonine protein kinase
MIKMIEIMEEIHKTGIVHRDIKPQNFMLDEQPELFLIDFGLASVYIDNNKKHISQNEEYNQTKTCITGNIRYASWFVLNGSEPSRRDDLISIGYIFLLLATNVEPFYANNCKEMQNLKEWNSLFTQFNSNPQIQHIINYLKMCYELKWDDLPKYNELKGFFRSFVNNAV